MHDTGPFQVSEDCGKKNAAEKVSKRRREQEHGHEKGLESVRRGRVGKFQSSDTEQYFTNGKNGDLWQLPKYIDLSVIEIFSPANGRLHEAAEKERRRGHGHARTHAAEGCNVPPPGFHGGVYDTVEEWDK